MHVNVATIGADERECRGNRTRVRRGEECGGLMQVFALFHNIRPLAAAIWPFLTCTWATSDPSPLCLVALGNKKRVCARRTKCFLILFICVSRVQIFPFCVAVIFVPRPFESFWWNLGSGWGGVGTGGHVTVREGKVWVCFTGDCVHCTFKTV